MATITRVTKKGQATIPKALRVKFGIKDRVLVSATEEGVLFSPPPSPASDFGSLGSLFPGMTSKEVLEDARSPDSERDKKLSL
jgi:AbrB family looped-hinge helix DNA binding protein